MSAEKLASQPLEAILGAGLARFRASLPRDVGLHVALPQPPASLRVRARAGELQDVVVSLCMVAWQAMRGAAGAIIVELDDIVIDKVVLDFDAGSLQGGLPPRRHARLLITNNSQGLHSATHQAMAAPETGEPAAPATRRSLAEAREIIQQHHGSITVSTEVGVGTSFEVYLPVLAPQGDAAAAAEKGARRHIIYVDDYEPMRALVGETLADAGFRVSCYEGAREALTAVRGDPMGCDALVSDFKLSGYTGTDLIRRVRDLRPGMPTVLISGYLDESLQAKAREVGADCVISKTSDLEALVGALRELLVRS
ncbi:MAG: response regulator [Burkholderiaceae bacterium]|nr:response regulator [Burkholderiaceae bacterium]